MVLRQPRDHVEDALGVAVGAVDDEHVDALLGEQVGAIVVVRTARDGRGHAQPVLRVAVVHGVEVAHERMDVGEAVEADEAVPPVDERELADAVLLHDGVGLRERRVRRGGHELRHGHHHGRDERVGAGGEADVGAREHAREAPLFVEDRVVAEIERLRLARGEDVGDLLRRDERDRVADEAVEVLLDAKDLLGLAFRREVLVDDADAAEHRHGDRHARLGHGVHRGAHERDVEAHTGGEARGDVRVIRQEVGVLGDEGHVVEREGLERKVLHEIGDVGIFRHGGNLLLGGGRAARVADALYHGPGTRGKGDRPATAILNMAASVPVAPSWLPVPACGARGARRGGGCGD